MVFIDHITNIMQYTIPTILEAFATLNAKPNILTILRELYNEIISYNKLGKQLSIRIQGYGMSSSISN